MSVRVRFAPSPTGPLHIGGVRTALYNYLFAKHHGGQNLLRIEDTDQNRYVPGAEQYIIEALAWVGITFDEGPHLPGGPHAPYRQSERKPMYRQYAEDLIERGWAYYAFDTEADLDEMRKRGEAAGIKSPQYNAVTREHMQNGLALPADEVKRRLADGVPYVIRFQMPRREEVRFEDKIRGWVNVNTAQLDDKVLLKSDGMPTYHLANIVDDHLMQITHVIRGEEWLPSTPLHVLLYQAFGWEAPQFAHLPLLLKPDGNGKLSKRDGDQLGFPVFPLEWTNPETGEKASGYRESGYLPEAMVNFLALLGWHSSEDKELFTMDELIQEFTLERVGKSGVKFDYQKGIWFNQHYLRARKPAELVPYLTEQLTNASLPVPDEARLTQVATLLHDRISFTRELLPLGRYFFEAPASYDAETTAKRWNADATAFVQALHDALTTQADWTATALEAAFNAVAAAAGKKPGQVLGATRLALTGMGFGPGLFDIMSYLGQIETVQRLVSALAQLPVPTTGK